MARVRAGGTTSDFVYSSGAGGLIRTTSATLTVWSAESGGAQLTDLLLDGNPVSTIPVPSTGQVPDFDLPDGVFDAWVSADGGSTRVKLTVASEDAQFAAAVANPASATRGALSATYGMGRTSLNALGLTAATPDIGALITAGIAAGHRHFVIPRTAYTLHWTTKVTASDIAIEFEEGAEVNVDTPQEAGDFTAVRLLGPVRFVSNYAGPSSAADDTNGHYGLDVPGEGEHFPRSWLLHDDCRVEGGWYQQGACSGIQIRGARVGLYGTLTFKDIRHRKGWGSVIHVSGSGAYDIHQDGFILIEDSDRGCEVEEGAVDVTFNGGGRQINVFPAGYTGQPGDYATYTFNLDAHTHSGEGAPVGIRYNGKWVLENCGGGVTFIRSTGTNESDLPRNCYVEEVHFIGRGMSTGYEDLAVQGAYNAVGRAYFEEGSGIAGGTFKVKGYADSKGNTIGPVISRTDAAHPTFTDAGTGLFMENAGMGLFTTVGNDPGVVAQLSAAGGQTWPSANQAILVRLRAPRTIKIADLRWIVGAQAGNYDIGIYDADGVRLWHRGATAVPAAGTVVAETVSPAVVIRSGQEFYVAMSADTATTFTVKGAIMASAEITKTLLGKGASIGFNTAHPLPSSFSMGTQFTVSRLPLVTIREA